MTTKDPIKSGPHRVLVADDDPIMVALVGGWLRDAGLDVIEAPDGTNALEVCVARNPDLAIIDFEMPDFGEPNLRAASIHIRMSR